MHALFVTHGFAGAAAAEHAELADELEPSVAAIPGLVSRTTLENPATGRYGAFYVFDTKSAFNRFVASELYGALYGHSAVTGVTASDFAVRGGDEGLAWTSRPTAGAASAPNQKES